MSTEASCTFKVTGWDEKPYQEFEGGAKLTRAKVSQAYQGAINGEGLVEFLMSYAASGTASFVGMELVKGTVAGKSGSFVIQHVGTYDMSLFRCLSVTSFRTMPNTRRTRPCPNLRWQNKGGVLHSS